jgi:hypothetical protein
MNITNARRSNFMGNISATSYAHRLTPLQLAVDLSVGGRRFFCALPEFFGGGTEPSFSRGDAAGKWLGIGPLKASTFYARACARKGWSPKFAA